MEEDLTSGLKAVHADTQVGHGFVQLDLGATSEKGLFARAEAGYRPLENVDLFGFAEANQQQGALAGIGARVSF